MAKFVIAPHMRPHEWVAEEKGYFAAEGLDYEFREQLSSKDGKQHDLGNKVGAFQTFERGRNSVGPSRSDKRGRKVQDPRTKIEGRSKIQVSNRRSKVAIFAGGHGVAKPI